MNKESLERKQRKLNVLRVYNDARRDINTFTPLVMRDAKTGESFQQAEHHRVMQNHITQCFHEERYAGILAPWGSG